VLTWRAQLRDRLSAAEAEKENLQRTYGEQREALHVYICLLVCLFWYLFICLRWLPFTVIVKASEAHTHAWTCGRPRRRSIALKRAFFCLAETQVAQLKEKLAGSDKVSALHATWHVAIILEPSPVIINITHVIILFRRFEKQTFVNAPSFCHANGDYESHTLSITWQAATMLSTHMAP
jgi:hypothetical protein